MRYLLLLLLLFACRPAAQAPAPPPPVEVADTVVPEALPDVVPDPVPEDNLFDSIRHGRVLRYEQLEIDSMNHDADFEAPTFTGISVNPTAAGIMVALVEMNDHRNCINKLLFTFTPAGKKIAMMQVASGCDGDLSVWSDMSAFAVLNDHIFKITTTAYPPDDVAAEPVITLEEIWNITETGALEQTWKKEHPLPTIPKKD